MGLEQSISEFVAVDSDGGTTRSSAPATSSDGIASDGKSRVTVLHHETEMVRSEQAWRILAEGFDSPLMQFDWFIACAKALCSPGQLSVVLNSRGGRVTGVAPVSVRRGSGRSYLEILGSFLLCEPTGFLYSDRTALEELIESLLAMNTPIVLRRIDTKSPELDILARLSRSRHWLSLQSTSYSPWIPIQASWQEYEKALPARRRSDLRRARKRAEAEGSVTVDIISPSQSNLGDCVCEFMCVEGKSWKKRAGTSLQSNEALHDFFSQYLTSVASKGMVRFGFLRIAGRAVAGVVGLEYARRFWVLKIGYDENYAKCSPGILVMHEMIHYAFERTLEAYEFLGNDEQWIHTWRHRVREYKTLRLYPPALKSILNLGIDGVAFLTHKALGKERAI